MQRLLQRRIPGDSVGGRPLVLGGLGYSYPGQGRGGLGGLVQRAESTNPTRYSTSGFIKSSETLLFGVISVASLVIGLGSVVMLFALFILMAFSQKLENIWIACAGTGFSSIISVSVGYSIYESYGTVLISTILILSGIYFLYVFLETVMISANFMSSEQAFLDFSNSEAGIFAVVLLVNYYYSLTIAFPLIQVPFFMGLVYFVALAGQRISPKVPEKYQPFGWLLLSSWSITTIFYMLIFREKAFIMFGTSHFMDFRLLGYITCSLTFVVSISWFFYTKYCMKFHTQPESFSVLIHKYSHLEASEDWIPQHNYVLMNFCAFGFMSLLGVLCKVSSLIFFGYLGSTFMIVLLPKSRHSTSVYSLLILVGIIISSILGNMNDSSFIQLYVFYPRSYVLGLLLVVIRILCTAIGLINANIYRSTHFTTHSAIDTVTEFGLSYVRTISLIALGEMESSWVMSWVYYIGILLNLDPTLRIESQGYTDEIIRIISLLFYGIRLALISYQQFVPYYCGIFLIFIGMYKAFGYSMENKKFKYLTGGYAWIVLQMACCIDSWVLFVGTAMALCAAVTSRPEKLVNYMAVGVVGGLLGLFYFVGALRDICVFTLHFNGICSLFGNESGYFIEKEIALNIIKYFR